MDNYREKAGDYTRIYLNRLSFKIHDLEKNGDFETARKLDDLLGIAKNDSFSLSDIEVQKRVIAEYPQKIKALLTLSSVVSEAERTK